MWINTSPIASNDGLHAARLSVIISMSHVIQCTAWNPTAVFIYAWNFFLSLHSFCSLFAALMTSLIVTPPPGEAPGGREQEAGDQAEDPEGARGVRRQDRRHRQAAGERDGGAD